jgi:hypothetical protein
MKRNLLIVVAVALFAVIGLSALALNWDQQATDDQMSNALSHEMQPGHVIPPPGRR